MKISSNTPVSVRKSSGSGGKKTSGASESSADRVNVAGLEQLRQMAAGMVKTSEAGRAERLDEIKNALERGEYHVPARDLSIRIVGAASLERGVW
ncbi:MAG: flagellar biosynthesis anti-sigma factor FlgM [Zetaproteobacteria bacterium]|nr:flagellar biosynthesis anti-sigma factor FlgM [Zetaproteobacteria bacterium]